MLASSAPALPSRHLEIKQASRRRRRRRHAAAGGGNRNSCARNLTSLCQCVLSASLLFFASLYVQVQLAIVLYAYVCIIMQSGCVRVHMSATTRRSGRG
jgi:hypothetical protein